MASEAIAPPDVEAVVLDYLRPLLGIPCSSAIPSQRPPTFAVVTVSPSLGFVGVALFEAFVTVQTYSSSRVTAAQKAREVVAYLGAATAFHARSDGYGWLPDPIAGTPGYVSTATIHIRGNTL